MELISIIAIMFSVFALSRTILRYKDKKVKVREFILWIAIWVCMIIVAIIPKAFGKISRFFGIQRTVDFLIYASIIVLFYLLFRILVRIESLEQNITKIVRDISIRKRKK
ncbi:MAG: DUF2304 family protein [Nanoarchaeota archaeon]|nr:DUF2304 family protein [Nanoarchaeota archaeon]MBU1029791.1 DUF2304 family protein [Nanoarchaeota archaeon]MBU1850294.1 DUF2304 family protein [Nanoarchaeota archaeon]